MRVAVALFCWCGCECSAGCEEMIKSVGMFADLSLMDSVMAWAFAAAAVVVVVDILLLIIGDAVAVSDTFAHCIFHVYQVTLRWAWLRRADAGTQRTVVRFAPFCAARE